MRDFIIHCIYQLDMKQAQVLILELRILKALRVLPTKVASWLDGIKSTLLSLLSVLFY